MSYDQALEHHLQRMLMADLGLSWQGVQADSDGEICFLDEHDRMMSVVIIDLDGSVWARVWVVAASGLKRSAKLMREINELNIALLGSRALLTPDGRLVIAAELTLESIEPGELARLVGVLSEHAERSGPMIQLMYGAGGTPKESREVES